MGIEGTGMEVSPSQAAWIIRLLMVGFALAALWFAFRCWRRARVIEDTPTSRVRSAAQGYVELCGRTEVAHEQALQAPLTGAECCWWSFEVERPSKENSGYETVAKETSKTPFLLLDGQDRCEIHPRGAEVTGGCHDSWFERGLPAKFRNDLRELLHGAIGPLTEYRYTETYLPVGARIYAIGDFSTRTASSIRAQRERTVLAENLRARKADQSQLLQDYDADGDGEIDMREWGEVTRDERDRAKAAVADAAIADVHQLKRDRQGRPFLISTMSQRKQARRYRWQALGGILAFFGLLIALVTHLMGMWWAP